MKGVKIELVPGLPWNEVDERIAAAWGVEGVCKRVQAFFLHDLKVRRGYRAMGFASVAHYGMERHGMSQRRVNELLQVGAQLQDLEDVDAAYLDGELNWSQVQQLLRVVRVSNQDEWIARAKELKTVARLRKAVDQARAGRAPRGGEGRGLPGPRFEYRVVVDQEGHDRIERVRGEMMRKSGRPVTDSELFTALGYEHKLEQIDEERDAARRAAAEDKETPEWLRNEVLARDRHRCVSCGDGGDMQVHHILFREDGGRTSASNLTTICLRCHGLVHSGLLQIRGEAPDELRFLDRFGNPRDASIAPVLELLVRPPAEHPGEHAPGIPYFYSADDIPRDLPWEWAPGKHPQLEWAKEGVGIVFIPLEEVLAKKR